MDQDPPNTPFKYPSFPSSPPSPSGFSSQWFSWVDELIDFTECTQSSHRRTFSAFEPLVTANLATSSTPPSNHNDVVIEDNYKPNVNPPDLHAQSNQPIHHIHSEGETSSAQDTTQLSTLDPKRIKRILANRQSARRSRERKLQYISELQKCVGKLETDVATLTPRVAYFDCQRSKLVMQNSQLKQCIAILAQDMIIKDALQESLQREIARLSQVHQRQNLTKTDAMTAAIDAGGEDTATIFVQNDFYINP